MKSYNHLLVEQHQGQRLVDEFNADERQWQSLAWKRVQRRMLYPHLLANQHSLLDLLEFDKARPPQDCIGEWKGKRRPNRKEAQA